ncbi:hypothetical protein MKK75_12630 [Methylobacterium sp. J-030]|uniref:hypothetical protein n=1 Tax=Methylobacterium sp. J-030 TaxID=2836627 RepID=UPI001FB9F0F2|nr:hypothetical protein [Methylobacterium sp. J-030]MCJ2069624.1 hypothetical protein [Methylobacterium sp. J-030]
MKLTLEPTDRIEDVRGTPCRVWSGTTDAGTPVLAWIPAVQPQTHDPDELAAFEAELRKMPYRRELVSFDLRMVE